MKSSKANSNNGDTAAKIELNPGTLKLPWYIDKNGLDFKNVATFRLGRKVPLAFIPTPSVADKIKRDEPLHQEENFVLARRDDFGYWQGKEIVLVPDGKSNTANVYIYRSSGRCVAIGKARVEEGIVRFTVELQRRKTKTKKYLLTGTIGHGVPWGLALNLK